MKVMSSQKQKSITSFFQSLDQTSRPSTSSDSRDDVVFNDTGDKPKEQMDEGKNKNEEKCPKKRAASACSTVKENKPEIKKKTYSFREEWKVSRDWLNYDENERIMFCSLCQKHDKSGKQNAFRTGCGSLRLHEVKVHENTETHKRSEYSELARLCAQNCPQKLPLEQAVMKIDSKNTEVLKKLFQAAYFLVKNEKPYTDFPKILDLLATLEVDVGHSYSTDKKAREFVMFINETITNEIISELKTAEFFSVLCDGTTDVSTNEQEIMFIRYVHEGKPKTVFICVSTVARANANNIKDAIVDMFKSHLQYKDTDDWKNSLVGVCFDGASVMMGCRTGVSTRLKTFAPHLVAIHCCAHRLELAVKDTAKSSSYMPVIDDLLYDIYSFYKYSANRWEGLQETARALNVRLMRPVKCSGVRWLPHHERAIKAVHQSYDALATHLENEAKSGNQDNQDKSRKILMHLLTIKCVMFLNFYLVFLKILAKLSLVFQSDSSYLHTIHDAVELTSIELEKMSNDSEGLKTIMMDGINITENEVSRKNEYSFKGHLLSVPEREGSRSWKRNVPEEEIQKALSEAKSVVTRVKENIAQRFHMENEMTGKSFVLDPEMWPREPDSLNCFGDNEIKALFKHFEKPLTSKGYSCENALLQWTSSKKQILKLKMCEPGMNFLTVWQRFASFDVKNEHRDILALVRVILSLPVNSAICERGFSLLKRVKSDWRACLKSDSLSDLMSIQLNGPKLEHFDPADSIALWMTKARRYQRHPYGKRSHTSDKESGESEHETTRLAWDSEESGPEEL